MPRIKSIPHRSAWMHLQQLKVGYQTCHLNAKTSSTRAGSRSWEGRQWDIVTIHLQSVGLLSIEFWFFILKPLCAHKTSHVIWPQIGWLQAKSLQCGCLVLWQQMRKLRLFPKELGWIPRAWPLPEYTLASVWAHSPLYCQLLPMQSSSAYSAPTGTEA